MDQVFDWQEETKAETQISCLRDDTLQETTTALKASTFSVYL